MSSTAAPTFLSSTLTDKHLLLSVNVQNPAECYLFTGFPVPRDFNASSAFQSFNNDAPPPDNAVNVSRELTPYASDPGVEYSAHTTQAHADDSRNVQHSFTPDAQASVDPRETYRQSTPYPAVYTPHQDADSIYAPTPSPVHAPTPSPAPSQPPIDAYPLFYPPTPPASPPRADTALSAPAALPAIQQSPDGWRPPTFKRPSYDRVDTPSTAFTGDSLLRTPPGLHVELDAVMHAAQEHTREAAQRTPTPEPDAERVWEHTLGTNADWRDAINTNTAASYQDWRNRPIGPSEGPFFGSLCPGCSSAQPAPMDRRLQYIEDSLADLGHTLNGLRESAERRMDDIYRAIDRVGEDAAEARYYTDHIYYDHDRGVCVLLDRLQHTFTTLHNALDNNLSRIDNTLWHIGSDMY